MPHFYIQPKDINGTQAILRGSDVKHIKTVLRLSAGAPLSFFDGTGKVYQGEILTIGKEIELKIVAQEQVSEEGPHICLAQALLKSDKMDWVIQKTTELGIHEIFPFMSKRTVPDKVGEKKVTRWNKIAQEAAKQCGRPNIPTVHTPLHLTELEKHVGETTLKLIPWEGEDKLRIEEVLHEPGIGTDLRARGVFSLKNILYVIGPEGGFEAAEIHKAKAQGFFPIHLGRRILRAETAAIVTLALLQHQFGNI